MRHEIIMPALGMAQDTGKLLAWHKDEGEAVTQGEILFEVETDKTTMDVEAPASGYLVNVSASNGDDVPVGQVIALISDSASGEASASEATSSAESAAASEDTLPEGQTIIMPVLGMAQDSGVLVGWNKEIGDAVDADDILFEVETDKSVVEVPAGQTGYLSARLAVAGDDVPTGETIAIISAEKSDQTVDRAYQASASAPAAASAASESAAEPVRSAAPKTESATTRPAIKPVPGGRVLASPKLRRMAHQAGYDLNLLAATGLSQPFHARDFDALKKASEAAAQQSTAGAATGTVNRFSAQVPVSALPGFVTWALEQNSQLTESTILAAFAGASLDSPAIVQVDRHGQSATYATRYQLADTEHSDASPDLVVHDLRGTFITQAEVVSGGVPVLAIMTAGESLALTLTCSEAAMPAAQAAVVLNNFAGRLNDPLRHLF